MSCCAYDAVHVPLKYDCIEGTISKPKHVLFPTCTSLNEILQWNTSNSVVTKRRDLLLDRVPVHQRTLFADGALLALPLEHTHSCS